MKNVTGMGNKNGLMDLVTKENGETEKQTDMENYIMLMETFTKESGLMIKLIVLGHTLMQMELNTLGSGKMTNNMDKDLKRGLMEQFMMDNILKGKKTVGEN